jgi:hypothetical protein
VAPFFFIHQVAPKGMPVDEVISFLNMRTFKFKTGSECATNHLKSFQSSPGDIKAILNVSSRSLKGARVGTVKMTRLSVVCEHSGSRGEDFRPAGQEYLPAWISGSGRQHCGMFT